MNLRTCITLLLCTLSFISYGQNNKETTGIKQSIIGFLKWYTVNNNSLTQYDFVDKRPVNDTLISRSINWQMVDSLTSSLYNSGYISSNYIYRFKNRIKLIGEDLSRSEPLHKNPIVKVDGLDEDIVLQYPEPELILDNLQKGKFTRIYILGNKGLAALYLPDKNHILFALTRVNNKWLIDDIGYIN